MRPIQAIMIGAGERGNDYARYTKTYPDSVQFVGVAEPSVKKRDSFAKNYHVDEANCAGVS